MRLMQLCAASLALTSLTISPATWADQIIIEDIGLQTPESVEYFAGEDVYLVTNINGSPFEKDGNGFISKISPSGEVIDLKWIDGNKAGISLNAPKGAAVNGNRLYVADLDEVHIFKLPEGTQQASVKIKDTLFLNGITPASDGAVYVSDSGFIPGFKQGGSDAIYRVNPDGSHQLVFKDTRMNVPNGLFTQGKDIIIGSSRSTNIFRLKPDGSLSSIPTISGMDGLLILPNGDFLFSSWKDQTVYRMDKAGNTKVVGASLKSPADLGYDPKRNRALVPIFLENKLVFLSL